MRNLTRCLIFSAIFLITPLFVSANYYTKPIDVSEASTSAYFDHDTTSNQKYYDDDDGSVHSYDNHHGIDFQAASGTPVKATHTGAVRAVGWQSPCCAGYGYRIYLYASSSAQRTLYGHLTPTTTLSIGQVVARGDVIAESGNTGSSTAPHLHFGVYDCDCTDIDKQVDPFGWQVDDEEDPWPYNENHYLWTTDPPSFELASTVSNDITSDTAWRGNILVDGGLSVTSGDTLTIAPKTVVKFSTTTSGLTVNGTLKAVGSLTAPIYFTSSWDDTVGGFC